MGRPRNPPPETDDALLRLEAEWAERGAAAIKTIREADPIAFFRMVARLVLAGGEDE